MEDERLEQLKACMEYLGISYTAAAAAVGVSAKTIGNYLNGVTYDAKAIRKLEIYLRSREFYRGYSFQHKDDFSGLFDELWNKCKEYMSTDELCETLCLTLSEANHIRENRKTLDVRSQYDILCRFHELCFDNTGLYRPDFKESGENLHLLLGFDFPVSVTQHFADLLNELTDSLDFRVSDEALARAANLPSEDMIRLRHDNDCSYDVWKKCDILDAMRRLVREHKSKEAETVWQRLNRLLIYYDGKNTLPENLAAETELTRWLDRKITEFRKFNIEIQYIILNHGRAFFDIPTGSGFWDYLQSYPVPAKLGLGEIETISEFDYFKSIMELFRLLPEKEKEELFSLAAKDFALHFPCWRTNEGVQDFELIVQCLELSLLAKDKGRLIKFSTNEDRTDLKNKMSSQRSPVPVWWWDYYSSAKAVYKLGFNSQEWCLWALFCAAVRDMRDLSPFIQQMPEMPLS